MDDEIRITIGWNRQLTREQTLEIKRSCEQVTEVFGGEQVRSGETDTSETAVCFQFDDQGKAGAAFELLKESDLEGRYRVKIMGQMRNAGGVLEEYHGTPPPDDDPEAPPPDDEPLNADDVMKGPGR